MDIAQDATVRIRRSEITHIGGKLQRFSLSPEIKGILGHLGATLKAGNKGPDPIDNT
jgi:hypothetical protein